MNQKVQSNWYQRIPASDRAALDELAKWVRPIPWQLFVTVTFPWNVASETADRKLRDFLNELERVLKTRICFLAGKEGYTKSGSRTPWHFHLQLAAVTTIPPSLVERSWKRLIGRTNSVEDDNVLVEAYVSDAPGTEYIAKMMCTLESDWDFKWLDLFNPNIPYKPKVNHRSLRRKRRWQANIKRSQIEEPLASIVFA
jgi:hypothetical protein